MENTRTRMSIDVAKKEKIITALLEKVCGYYRVILELARTEHEKFVARRPLTDILPILKKKKILLSCIDEVEEDMKSLRQEGAIGVNNEQIQSLVTMQRGYIQDLLLFDEKNQQFLQHYMQDLKGKVDSLKKKPVDFVEG
jgi:hypothetical protein